MSLNGASSRRCRLCGEKAYLFYAPEAARLPYYWRCPSCGFIFLDPRFHPSRTEAKERYLLHDNSEGSNGYGDYLERFIKGCILPFAAPGSSVLDFGSGPQNPSLLSRLLSFAGHSCDSFDPIFAPTRAWRRKKYGCIIIHEVAEHLPLPRRSFAYLAQRLESGGILAIRTRFPPGDSRDFGAWWYRMDVTHLSFYPPDALNNCISGFGLDEVFRLRPDSIVFKLSGALAVSKSNYLGPSRVHVKKPALRQRRSGPL